MLSVVLCRFGATASIPECIILATGSFLLLSLKGIERIVVRGVERMIKIYECFFSENTKSKKLS